MKLIDLSHEININMSAYTKEEKTEISDLATIENDGYNEKSLRICTHTGTHIDAPYHMISRGRTIDQFSLNEFLGKALIIDVKKYKDIDIDNIIKYKEKIEKSDFVIFKTGWEKYFGKEEYLQDYPSLTIEAAKWLCEFDIKGIGIDTISIDKFDSIDFKIHNTILSKDKFIIENLNNLSKIEDEFFTLISVPLKIKSGDAAPVRAIAVIE